jgi:hypothetical protein
MYGQNPNFLVEIHLSRHVDETSAVRCAVENDFPGIVLVDFSASFLSFYWQAPDRQSAGEVVRRLQLLLSLPCVEGFRLCQGGIDVGRIDITKLSKRPVLNDHLATA